MTINPFSIFMSILLFTATSLLCSVFLTHTRSNRLWIVALVLGLSIFRCIVPLEIDGSFVINCWEIYPGLLDILRNDLFHDITVGTILCSIWLLGSVVTLSLQTRELFRQLRIHKTQPVAPADSALQAIGERAAIAVSCEKPPRLYTVTGLASPVMIGFIHPYILFPDYMLFYQDREIEYILRHEISHYMGGDNWIRLILQLLICIFWWNPAVYFLRQNVVQLLELRCDNRACHALTENSRLEYASVLVRSLKEAESLPTSQLILGFVGSRYKAFVRQRIQILLSPPPTKPAPRKIVAIAITCFALFVGSYAFIFQPAYAPPQDPGYMYPTAENSWLIPLENGRYDVWVDGKYLSSVSAEAITQPPFNEFPIYQEED